jgi:FtsP/CotA-like multicopper oxidase with cupredoxin domain
MEEVTMSDPARLEPTSPHAQDAVLVAAPLTPPSSDHGLTKFLDPLRIPPVITVPGDMPHGSLRITMRPASVKLHSQLPPTSLWTYDGSFPGPTIEVRSGQTVHASWENAITGSFPLVAVDVPVASATAGPGRDGAPLRADVAALPSWTVVHLHGARTNAWNDGWTENAALVGGHQRSEYPNDQRATTLWYHDHAMGITGLNVMTGLAGMYLIRDEEENALHLPHGEREVPLIICDRNLDTDAQGNLTSQLLHKIILRSDGVMFPFLGPFTLVNGVIWPHLEVDARWYRFRMLNASNSRFYGLTLRDEQGAPVTGALQQIGTDGGLLPKPVALDEVTLAPAERADILIDFSAFRGRSLTLANTLTSAIPGVPTTPNPDVMQFRVRTPQVDDHFTLPGTISKSFVRLTHDALPADHGHRWVVLTLLNGKDPELWEMEEIDQPPANLPVDGIVQVKLADGTVTTLRRVNRTFRDAANFYIDYDGWEVWNILNLSPVVHPIHLHLVQFQTIGLGRQRFDIQGFNNDVGGTSTPVTYMEPGTLDASDQGWKDTIRVGRPDGSGELVTIAARFEGGTGRYMYHCHILEHEDEGMMRTFVVTPKEVMAVDPMHGPMHEGNHSHGMDISHSPALEQVHRADG